MFAAEDEMNASNRKPKIKFPSCEGGKKSRIERFSCSFDSPLLQKTFCLLSFLSTKHEKLKWSWDWVEWDLIRKILFSSSFRSCWICQQPYAHNSSLLVNKSRTDLQCLVTLPTEKFTLLHRSSRRIFELKAFSCWVTNCLKFWGNLNNHNSRL